MQFLTNHEDLFKFIDINSHWNKNTGKQQKTATSFWKQWTTWILDRMSSNWQKNSRGLPIYWKKILASAGEAPIVKVVGKHMKDMNCRD